MPPGHAAVPAGSCPSKCRDQKTLPVSLSIAKTRFAGPATVESGVKRVTPGLTTPWVSEIPWRAGLSSLVFHCSANPGRLMDSIEMLVSVRTQEERWASPYAVGHGPGLGALKLTAWFPRPWPKTTAASRTMASAATKIIRMRIVDLLPSGSGCGDSKAVQHAVVCP